MGSKAARYWADQKRPIPVPRVRNRIVNREVTLTTYEQLQRPRAADAGLFRKILVGLTCRQYPASAAAVPQACGLSASRVSRRFIRAGARHRQTFWASCIRSCEASMVRLSPV